MERFIRKLIKYITYSYRKKRIINKILNKYKNKIILYDVSGNKFNIDIQFKEVYNRYTGKLEYKFPVLYIGWESFNSVIPYYVYNIHGKLLERFGDKE